MDMEMLPVVDVNVESVESTWPALMAAVGSADFVSLDLELSGLGSWVKQKSRSLDDKYSILREVVSSHSVLSLGVGCYQWGEEEEEEEEEEEGRRERGLVAQVYDVLLLCQEPYTVQPSSLKFLVCHGFDFNKQCSSGLPYTPGLVEHPSKQTVHSLMAAILRRGCPVVLHNGLVDLVFLYGSFYAPLPHSASVFLADACEMFAGGGLYDTKCIAEFHVREPSSFLEYIFRKSQQASKKMQGKVNMTVSFAEHPSPALDHVVHLPLGLAAAPSHPPELEGWDLLEVCPTYASLGYCPKPESCGKCHDIMVVLSQEGKKTSTAAAAGPQQQRGRKRKRKARDQETKEDETSSLYSLFQKDIQTVQERLLDTAAKKPVLQPDVSAQSNGGDRDPRAAGSSTNGQAAAADTHTTDINTAAPDHKAAAAATGPKATRPTGHKAALDAFMTGYCFAYYALAQKHALGMGPHDKKIKGGSPLQGITKARNCLALGGTDVPLRVVKSHFVTTSKTHQKLMSLPEWTTTITATTPAAQT